MGMGICCGAATILLHQSPTHARFLRSNPPLGNSGILVLVMLETSLGLMSQHSTRLVYDA